MVNFTIDENYVITAIEIDGVTYTCSIQIAEGWEPYLILYALEEDALLEAIVGDVNDDSNFGAYGECDTFKTEQDDSSFFIPEVNLVYMGTKYNYIKVWDGAVWLTDRAIGNRLFDTDGDGHLNYTINYLPVSIQFIQVNETDYSVMSTSMVYTADHNGTWAIYDDGHWERLDNRPSEEVEEIDNGR